MKSDFTRNNFTNVHFDIVPKEIWIYLFTIKAQFTENLLQVIIIGSEIPFVGDDPISIKEKAEKVDFLKDHWPYNDEDLGKNSEKYEKT